MSPVLYQGSVKDVVGPFKMPQGDAVVFEYSDGFSVFDWGRMPDLLLGKGEALAILAAYFFEELENPERWKEFSKTPEALELRKNRYGAEFNELGEKLQSVGLRTHYIGLGSAAKNSKLGALSTPVRQLLVKQVQSAKPAMVSVLGRQVPDYSAMRALKGAKLIPSEVVFRFSVPSGSSLIERLNENPHYLNTRGYLISKVDPGQKFGFPVLELFSKLEPKDRPLEYSEALPICGITGSQMQHMIFSTAWVAGFLKWKFAQAGFELADGKLEWGMDESGQIILVDAIGPDELRILKDGVQISKEFLRGYYRKTPWYNAVLDAKAKAEATGSADWKRGVSQRPDSLPLEYRDLAVHLYLTLANCMTQKKWFPKAYELPKLIDGLRTLGSGA